MYWFQQLYYIICEVKFLCPMSYALMSKAWNYAKIRKWSKCEIYIPNFPQNVNSGLLYLLTHFRGGSTPHQPRQVTKQKFAVAVYKTENLYFVERGRIASKFTVALPRNHAVRRMRCLWTAVFFLHRSRHYLIFATKLINFQLNSYWFVLRFWWNFIGCDYFRLGWHTHGYEIGLVSIPHMKNS